MDNQLRDDLMHLNALSKDIYDEERRLSFILSHIGFDSEQLSYLQGQGLAELLQNIDFSLRCVFFSYKNGAKYFYIIYHRYGLFGYEKKTLESIGQEYGISRERVRQLQAKALSKLRRGAFKSNVIASACKVFNIDSYEKLSANSSIVRDQAKSIKKNDDGLLPFAVTPEMNLKFCPSESPISISEFVRNLNAIKPDTMKNLHYRSVIDFLLGANLLETYEKPNGGTGKRPTDTGASLGITTEQRDGKSGVYIVTLYNKEIQQFIVDNIDAVSSDQNKVDSTKDLQGTPWTSTQEECLVDLFRKNVSVDEIAIILKRSTEGIRARLKKLGLIEHRSDAK